MLEGLLATVLSKVLTALVQKLISLLRKGIKEIVHGVKVDESFKEAIKIKDRSERARRINDLVNKR